MTPDDIDHVNAHATSTPEGDKAELQAIRTIFGDDAGRISITANKSMLGHTLGAAGAIEAIVTILSIRDGCVPPTINLADPDPAAAGLDLTPERGGQAAGPDGAQQLVRVRRPEHRAHLRGAGHDRPATDPLEPMDRPSRRGRRSARLVHRPSRPGARRRRVDRRDGAAAEPRDGGDVELLALIDRLAELLERSDLAELEVESGGTGLDPAQGRRRSPAAAASAGAAAPRRRRATGRRRTLDRRPRPGVTAPPSVKAPLTGIFYASPAPGTAPYVQVGGEVAVGQVIGLIEAMKLFNEIKSDLAGRVVRVVPESGALVKAKQPLIEVEPL